MSDCENLWRAIGIAWAWITYAACAGAVFWAGYQRGRRVEADAQANDITESDLAGRPRSLDFRTMLCSHDASKTCLFCKVRSNA